MEDYKELKTIGVGGRVYLGIIDEEGNISSSLWRKGKLGDEDLAEWFKLQNAGMLGTAQLSAKQPYIVEDLTVEQKRKLETYALAMQEAKATAAPQWENKVFDELRRD